jgi:hypothetical protein
MVALYKILDKLATKRGACATAVGAAQTWRTPPNLDAAQHWRHMHTMHRTNAAALTCHQTPMLGLVPMPAMQVHLWA